MRSKWLAALLCLPVAAQTVEQLNAQARQKLAAGDANGALVAYQKLAKLVPKSAPYQDQIGFLLAATSRTPDAIPHFERATELDPKLAQAWFHLGAGLIITHQLDAGIKDLQHAVALAPDRADYRFPPRLRLQ